MTREISADAAAVLASKRPRSASVTYTRQQAVFVAESVRLIATHSCSNVLCLKLAFTKIPYVLSIRESGHQTHVSRISFVDNMWAG